MAIDVLIVDEDEDVLDITGTFLDRQDDLSVATEADPERALERITDGGFDAVVSDLSMPGLDGFELCVAVRDAGLELPFLLFTGRDESELTDREGFDCVTAVVQKTTGTDQYDVLADHVRNAV